MSVYPLRCTTCGYEDEVIRAATLAGQVIKDCGEICPKCGGKMAHITGNVSVRFRGEGWQTPTKSTSKRKGEK